MIDRIMREVRRNIEGSGQHVFIIFPESVREPGFAYTIGNAGRGLPELLLIGSFPPALAGRILNELGAKMREDGRPLPEGLVDIGWTFPFKIRKAGPAARLRFTIQVGRYLGHERYDVLQVMICDAGGRYPGEKGCDPDFDVEQP